MFLFSRPGGVDYYGCEWFGQRFQLEDTLLQQICDFSWFLLVTNLRGSWWEMDGNGWKLELNIMYRRCPKPDATSMYRLLSAQLDLGVQHFEIKVWGKIFESSHWSCGGHRFCYIPSLKLTFPHLKIDPLESRRFLLETIMLRGYVMLVSGRNLWVSKTAKGDSRLPTRQGTDLGTKA